MLVTVAGILPDIDGLGIIIDKLTKHKTDYYFEYHHYFGHNIFFSIFIAILITLLSKAQKGLVFIMSLFLTNIHFICDIIGSKGPDGYPWPVYYLYPLDKSIEFTWSGQWELNAWQNQVIMAALLASTIYVASTKRISFIEVFSAKLDAEAFNMWQKYVKRNT